MAAKQVLVLGGGFAGLWSAVGAARTLDEVGLSPDAVAVTLVNRDAYHAIRVRNYEADLCEVRVPLDDVLAPIDVRRVEGDVVAVDFLAQQVTIQSSADAEVLLSYDRLVVAVGSQLVRPPLPGLAEYAFDVDTFAGAERLQRHLHALPAQAATLGQFAVVVVGAGLTGIEVACEMTARLPALLADGKQSRPFRVILADHNPRIGSDMGDSARPVIEEALTSLGIETRPGVSIASISASGVTLASGEEISAATVIWCAGMRAHPLTRLFPVERDQVGRLPVDEFLRVQGIANVFAAGDVAAARFSDGHTSVMSCQHGRPMGRFAGHNVVCDLLGLPMLPLDIPWYVTVLDLGPWGALYTEGWDRHVVTQGAAAKRTKQSINCQRIYPPRSGNRAEILAAAAPTVQRPPATYRPR